MTTENEKIGRPKGAIGIMTRKAREQAMQTGLLPHEILLDMARGNPQKVTKVSIKEGEPVVTEEWVSVTLEEQKDAAKAAAPYYAPKLSTVETVQGMTDGDIDQLIKQLAGEAGLAPATGGEGQEEQEGTRGGAGQERPARRRPNFG